MGEWVALAVYIAGWLITCRVLVRYAPDVYWELSRDVSAPHGLFRLGVLALVWPFMAIVGLFVLPVWLVTRGVDR